MIKLKVLICEIYLAVIEPWDVVTKWELIDESRGLGLAWDAPEPWCLNALYTPGW